MARICDIISATDYSEFQITTKKPTGYVITTLSKYTQCACMCAHAHTHAYILGESTKPNSWTGNASRRKKLA